MLKAFSFQKSLRLKIHVAAIRIYGFTYQLGSPSSWYVYHWGLSYTADVVDTEKWDIIYLQQTLPQQPMRKNKKLVWWQQTLHQKVFIINPFTFYLNGHNMSRKGGSCICVHDIDFPSFYDFFIEFLNCYSSVLFWNCYSSVLFWNCYSSVLFWNCYSSVLFWNCYSSVLFWNCYSSVLFCVFHLPYRTCIIHVWFLGTFFVCEISDRHWFELVTISPNDAEYEIANERSHVMTNDMHQ